MTVKRRVFTKEFKEQAIQHNYKKTKTRRKLPGFDCYRLFTIWQEVIEK